MEISWGGNSIFCTLHICARWGIAEGVMNKAMQEIFMCGCCTNMVLQLLFPNNSLQKIVDAC